MPLVYQKEQRSDAAGVGCLIQGFGVLLALLSVGIFGLVGAIPGFLLLIVFVAYGSSEKDRLACGKCGNPIADEKVTICPTCHATLE